MSEHRSMSHQGCKVHGRCFCLRQSRLAKVIRIVSGWLYYFMKGGHLLTLFASAREAQQQLLENYLGEEFGEIPGAPRHCPGQHPFTLKESSEVLVGCRGQRMR
jgi:hypothetical protein